MAIPVIDFSKLNGQARADTLAQIADCCENWGFFQLLNHGIPEELLERVKKVSTKCYEVERVEGFKDSNPVQLLDKLLEEQTQEGGHSKRLDNVDWEDVFTLLDDNEWPSRPAGFKETMKEYRAELKKLAEKVMEVMDENLGLERGYIKRAFAGGLSADGTEANPPFFGTKVSHYPPCPRPDLVSGIRAHTDAGGVILLFQDDKVGGLQVLKDGRWVDVQPLANAIVINIGDQVEVLSNGRYKSAWHRVLTTPGGNRRSIASFYNPSLKATISPAARLTEDCSQGTEAAATPYPRLVFGDYMDVYVKQKYLPKEPRFQAMAAIYTKA